MLVLIICLSSCVVKNNENNKIDTFLRMDLNKISISKIKQSILKYPEIYACRIHTNDQNKIVCIQISINLPNEFKYSDTADKLNYMESNIDKYLSKPEYVINDEISMMQLTGKNSCYSATLEFTNNDCLFDISDYGYSGAWDLEDTYQLDLL